MAYLDNTTEITIDAVLTRKGREKLASGTGNLEISKFALSDDEIDYTLYDTGHPQGSAYYDAAIRALPVLEATVDETKAMKYKLVTLPRGTKRLPRISAPGQNLNFNVYISRNKTDDPARTIQIDTPDNTIDTSFTLILADQRAGTMSGIQTNTQRIMDVSATNIRSEIRKIEDFEFTFFPRDASSFDIETNTQINTGLLTSISTTLTIIGDQTGATLILPVTVNVKP